VRRRRQRDPPFSAEPLRGLRDRSLSGVPLVVSDAHRGLSNANANAIVLKGTA
jgi:transposase-like protein